MQKTRQILIVDDEADLSELLAYNLQRAGHETVVASNGAAAIDALARNKPDLVILDVMMPELSGYEVAAHIRRTPATTDVPIIMLTARSEEADELGGLASGADDYLTKPFSMKVLLARIEAVLRRADGRPGAGKTLTLGPVEIDLDIHQVRVDSEIIQLTVTEFRLLASLIGAGGRVLSRPALILRAMGPGVTVTERTIDVHVTSIRKKLGRHAGLIRTVRGVGYRTILDKPSNDADTSPSSEPLHA